MGALTTVVYDKWDKGEFGTMNPSQAPNGSWTGNNVVVYKDGMIGPRPGMREITFSNAPSKNGPMLGLGFSPVAQNGNTPIFFILGDRPYTFKPAAKTPALVAAPTTPTHPPADTDASRVLSKESCRLIGDELYFTVNDDAAYRLNCRTQTLTRITDSDPEGQGTDIELFRDRMFVANGGVRVFYSDAANFDTWPSGSFFDVGTAYTVIEMLTFRDALILFTRWGAYTFTGSSPADGTLRRTSETLAPRDKASVVTNNEILYIPASRSAPVTYNGSYGDERQLMHLEEWKSASLSAYGVQSYGNRDVLFLSSDSDLLWRKNEAWSFHTMGGDVGPWITRYFDDNVVLAYPGTASVDPKFYMLSMNIERPGFTNDQFAQPGDDSDTPLNAYFSIPTYLAPEGKELRVRSVTVDFIKYDTGSSVAKNISVQTGTLYGQLEQGYSQSAPNPAVLFNEDGSFATSDGLHQRKVLRGTAGPFGGGYRVSLLHLRGGAIDRVVVGFGQRDSPVV